MRINKIFTAFICIFLFFNACPSVGQNTYNILLDANVITGDKIKIGFEKNSYNRRFAFGTQMCLVWSEGKGVGVLPYMKYRYLRFKNYGGLYLQPLLYFSHINFPYTDVYNFPNNTVSWRKVNSYGGGLGIGIDIRLGLLTFDVALQGPAANTNWNVFNNDDGAIFAHEVNSDYDPAFSTFGFTAAIGFSFPYQAANPKWKYKDKRYQTYQKEGINNALAYEMINHPKIVYQDKFFEIEVYKYSQNNNPFGEDFPLNEIVSKPGRGIVIVSNDNSNMYFLPWSEYNKIYYSTNLDNISGILSNIEFIKLPVNDYSPNLSQGKWTGSLSGNKPNGNGTFVFKDGSKYVGNLSNGKPEGEGIFYSSPIVIRNTDIKIIDGVWHDGYINGYASVTLNIPMSSSDKNVNIYSIVGNYKSSERYGIFYALDKNNNVLSKTSRNKDGNYIFPIDTPNYQYNSTDLGKGAIVVGGAIGLGLLYAVISNYSDKSTSSTATINKSDENKVESTTSLDVLKIYPTTKDMTGFGKHWVEYKVKFNHKIPSNALYQSDFDEVTIYYHKVQEKFYTNCDRLISELIGFNENDVKLWAIEKYGKIQ